MAELIGAQATIYEEIVRISTNFKKDSAERKTVDYFKQRVTALEQLWNDFSFNHDRINTEVSKSHTYFVEQEYEKTIKAYESTKALLNEQYQLLLSKIANPSKQRTPQVTSRVINQPAQQYETYEGVGGSSKQNERPFTTERGSTSKLDDLLRRQQAQFKAFVRTADDIDVESLYNKFEFKDALKSLESKWEPIESLNLDIDIELDGDYEQYDRTFHKYANQYKTLKKAIITRMTAYAHREDYTPKLEIPTFFGNYKQWGSFKSLFTDAIHKNNSLTNGQKMQFLKSKVRGEPEQLIKHLDISAESYELGWQILNDRYNNKQQIFAAHINTLLNLPIIPKHGLQQMKAMHGTTLECLNAIKNLGVDITSWDPWVVHVLSLKLDAELFEKYTDSLSNSKELPVLKDFLKFLENKFTNIETTRRKNDTVEHQKLERFHPKPNYQNNQDLFNTKKIINSKQSFNMPHYNGNKFAKSTYVSSFFRCPLCNQQHGIYNCKTYLEMPIDEKMKTAQKLDLCTNCLFSHHGQTCTSTRTCHKCPGLHNTILHDAFIKPTGETMPSTSGTYNYKHFDNKNKQYQQHGTSNASQDNNSEILLATALINVTASDGTYHNMRALIDQGSQVSLITERAAQFLNIKRQACKGIIFGVGQRENNCKGVITIECASLYSNFKFEAEVFIMNNLIKNLPNQTFNRPDWSYIEHLTLADPEFNKSRPVDLLLGADVYANIILGNILKGEHSHQPLAQQTQLGWLLCGNVKTFQCNVVLNDIENIHKFWEVEEIHEQSNLSVEDQECMNFYNETTTRKEDGRYEVRIPIQKDLKHKLGESKTTALAQFRNLERKLEKHEHLAQQYKSFMNEYLTLQHMKPSQCNMKFQCFLPHHGVQRDESTTTKYRVVYNASSRTSTGYSLNDIMYKGPNLQRDLQSLLLSWRQYPFAFTADLEKMYRQIRIAEEDQHLQKIVWRDSPEQPIQDFQLTTVTYGTKAAPFLAIMTLKKLASDERSRFPAAAEVLEQSFYVDDLVHGSYSIDAGKQIIEDLTQLLKSGGFNLRKWATNNEKLLENIANKQLDDHALFNFKTENMSKTLGLCWNPKEDEFSFRCDFTDTISKLTKRRLLSEISKLYDPLGWLTPLSTKLKLLFQKLWQNKLQWDDEVSDDIHKEWSRLKEDINNIQHFKIKRWIFCYEHDVIELHGYCDASMDAYACVVYAREKQNKKIVLVAAKSKLVPCKKALTLPRLELCGAQLLSKLINKIQQSMNRTFEVYGWSDSMVVLGWLNNEPSRWKPYVANRVQAITKIMPAKCWRYVKSGDNPADCASRGVTTTQLKEHSLWWQGPSWLSDFNPNEEKHLKKIYKTEIEARNIKSVNIIQQENMNLINNLLEKHNSFNKITRILAWIQRAITPKTQRKRLPNYLTLQELRIAKNIIVKHVQCNELRTDMENLRKNNRVDSKSSILNLNPFLDKEGILRVGGRLRNASININMKHPKIIPHKCRLAELLIDEAHLLTFHGGPRVTLANLRQHYWITSGNNTVKKQIRKCVTCRKLETRNQYQLMGDLPDERITPSPPFYHTGVDYTGFVDVKANKGRGVRTTKGYVALFICMVTKAVHLELVSDLTSSAFLAALKRMAARRGAPRHIYSDQGTNFIGADNILQEEFDQMQQIFNDYLLADTTDMNIEWHFNCPKWPSAGGLWERNIASLKFHFKRVIGEQKLTFEEFSTILAQLEACLNSRPLCPLTENIEDLDILTPGHFLTNNIGLTIIETEHDARTRWYLIRKLTEEIWKKWKAEYLSQLTIRSKWLKPQRNMEIGDLVMIHEDNVPVGKWAMGRIVDLHPGKDDLIRVVSLKTKNGIIRRPIIKLSLLPIAKSEHKPDESEQSNKSDSEQKHVKKNKANFMSIALALTFFMTLMTNTYGSFNITNKHNECKYFDKTFKTIDSGRCNMITPQQRHESQLLTYYDANMLRMQLNARSSRPCELIIDMISKLNSSSLVLQQLHMTNMNKGGIGAATAAGASEQQLRCPPAPFRNTGFQRLQQCCDSRKC